MSLVFDVELYITTYENKNKLIFEYVLAKRIYMVIAILETVFAGVMVSD